MQMERSTRANTTWGPSKRTSRACSRSPGARSAPQSRVARAERSWLRAGALGALGASSIGAVAAGALAGGAVAVGAMAIGKLAVKRAAIDSLRVGRLEIDRLTVGEL